MPFYAKGNARIYYEETGAGLLCCSFPAVG
jgi:hypothetical protein